MQRLILLRTMEDKSIIQIYDLDGTIIDSSHRQGTIKMEN